MELNGEPIQLSQYSEGYGLDDGDDLLMSTSGPATESTQSPTKGSIPRG
jgi:hypothetical protein